MILNPNPIFHTGILTLTFRQRTTLKCLVICFILCGLQTTDYRLLYAQQDNLEVKGKIEAQSLTIRGGDTFPAAPVKGEMFYRSDEDQYYTFDGASWQEMGGQDLVVATKVVAAVDSDFTERTADYICDGVNDQETIQQAIDALGANPGVVYLLEGTYNISDSINLNNTAPDDSGKAIIGAGKGTILSLLPGASGVNVINAVNVNGVLISQLMIDGEQAQGNPNDGIYFNAVTFSKIDKVWVENMGTNGIRLQASSDNIVSKSTLLGNGNPGIWLYLNSDNNIITGNTVSNNGYGIYLSFISDNNSITGNICQGNGNYGIYLYECFNNTITGNICQETIGGSGICLDYDSSNNTISGNSVVGNSMYGIWIYNASSYNSITGNICQDNGQHGIFLYANSANNNVVTGNKIHNNGMDGAYDGIRISTYSHSNLISLNSITDTQGTGFAINLDGNEAQPDVVTNNYLVGNYYSGTGASSIRDFGTLNTAYTDKTKLTFAPVGGYTGLFNGGTLTPNGPASFIRLNPDDEDVTLGTPALLKGKSAGDLLVLENTSPLYKVKFTEQPDLQLATSPLELSQNEVLILIWDGTTASCCWVQTGGKGS